MRFEQPVAPVESALEAYLRNVVEPAAAIATESIQAAIPGAQEIERKARQYRREGASQVEAVTRAYRESDLPPGVKGAIELGADPLNLIPGLGVVSVKTIPLAARAAAAGGRFAAKEMTVAAAQAAERAVPYAQKLRVGEAGFARIPGKPPARAVEVIIRDLRALGTQEGLDRATMNQVVKAVRNQDLLAMEELSPLPRPMQELVDRYVVAVQEGSAREARRIGKKIPSRPFSAIRTTKDDAIRAAREISPDEPLYVYQSPAGGFVATNDFDPALLDILKPDVLPPVKVARKARAKPAPVAEAPVEAIEVGDFIVGLVGGKEWMNSPRGFVTGEGLLGKGIPAWTVDLGGGRISAIPKDEARLLSKPVPEVVPGKVAEAVPLVDAERLAAQAARRAEVARGQAEMIPAPEVGVRVLPLGRKGLVPKGIPEPLYVDFGIPIYFDEGGYKVLYSPRWPGDPQPYHVSRMGYGREANFATPPEAISDARARVAGKPLAPPEAVAPAPAPVAEAVAPVTPLSARVSGESFEQTLARTLQGVPREKWDDFLDYYVSAEPVRASSEAQTIRSAAKKLAESTVAPAPVAKALTKANQYSIDKIKKAIALTEEVAPREKLKEAASRRKWLVQANESMSLHARKLGIEVRRPGTFYNADEYLSIAQETKAALQRKYVTSYPEAVAPAPVAKAVAPAAKEPSLYSEEALAAFRKGQVAVARQMSEAGASVRDIAKELKVPEPYAAELVKEAGIAPLAKPPGAAAPEAVPKALPLKVGDTVSHPTLGDLQVTDVSDPSLLTVRTSTGAEVKIGRGVLTMPGKVSPEVAARGISPAKPVVEEPVVVRPGAAKLKAEIRQLQDEIYTWDERHPHGATDAAENRIRAVRNTLRAKEKQLADLTAATPAEAVAPKVTEAIPPGAEGVPPTGGVPPTAEGGIAPSEPVLPRPRTLADMNREAKGMRAMTPEQRAAVMDVAKPIEGDILYQARPFDEHAQNLLGPDTNFMKALRGVPGVKQVFGAWHPAAMARDNPVAMIGLRQSIFQEIEKSRIRFATLRWWHDADAAFGFKRTRTAFGLKPASGVWKATKVKPASASVQRGKMFGTINDIIEHSERYAPFTDEQVKVLALAENTLTQSVRDAQRAGVNVVELAEAYWPRAVIRGPKGEKGFAGIRRRISGAKGYTHQRVFADIDDLVKPGFEVETDPRRVLASRLEAGVDTIAQANARKQIAALPGVEKPLERMARKFPEVLESARKARATRDEAKVAVVKARAKVTPEQVMAMRQAEADYISSMREVFAKKIEAGTPGYYELRLPSGRIAPQELVEEVGRFIDLPELRQPGRGAAALTQEVSQLLRTTLTNVDLAAGFIQGQALFYRNNVAWWKSQGHTVVSLVDDPTAWVAKNFDIIDEGVRMGAIVAPTEFLFAKQGIASIPLRVPYAGPALGSFNRAFEWFITTGQTELYKAARLGVAKNAGMDELVSLGSAIRKQVGTESYAILGIRTNQRTMEALSLFAARFFRANVGILGQSFTRGPGGAEARRAIGGLIAGGTALLIGINWALHKKLPEMTDPYAPSWMQFRLGNTYFSTFGPFYPYFRTIARMSMALIEGDPVKAATEAKRFLSSKESLPLRAIDIAGQLVYYGTANVYGTKIEKDWASIAKGILGEFVTPISIQEVPSAIVEGRPEQAFEIGGLVGRPVRLASEWQKDLEPYFDIPPEAEARFKKLKTREEYREKNPEVDAKLFIIGQVDSLKTIRAKFRAVALMRENGIGLKDIRSLEEKRYESKDHAALRRFFEAQFPQPQKKKGIWAPWKKQRIWAPGEYRPGGLPPPIPTRTPW